MTLHLGATGVCEKKHTKNGAPQRAAKQPRGNGSGSQHAPYHTPPPSRPSLLQALLAKEIRAERSLLLQCVRKDYDGAERVYRECLRIDPRHSMAHNNLGNLLKNHKKDIAGAEREYQLAIKLDPNNAMVHWNLSTLLEKRGDLRGAIDAVKGYIAAGNPDNDGEQRRAGLESKIS